MSEAHQTALSLRRRHRAVSFTMDMLAALVPEPPEGERLELFLAPFLLHLASYWLTSLLMLAADVYFYKTGRLEEVKLQRKQVPMTTDWAFYAHTAGKVLFNQLFITAPVSILFGPLFLWRGIRVDAPPPAVWVVALQFLGILFVEELMFYYVHRLLHHRALYKHIHKLHHIWKMPVGAAGLYAHPIEHLLANVLPSICGTLIFCPHYYTLLLWTAIASGNVVKAHSGYALGSPTHDKHHEVFTCNYGNFDWFDRVHGTRECDVFPNRKKAA